MIGSPLSGCRPTSRGSANSPSALSRSTIVERGAFRQAGALRLFFLGRFAELHIGAEAAAAQRDFQTGGGSLPSTFVPPSPAPFAARRSAGG